MYNIANEGGGLRELRYADNVFINKSYSRYYLINPIFTLLN